MKVRIAQTKNFFKQLILDLATEEFEHYTALDENDNVFNLPFKGFFDIVDDHLIVLYKKMDGKLSLVVDGLAFTMGGNFSVSYYVEGDDGFLKITDEHRSITVKFHLEDHKPVSSMFYTEDEEEANFGLWLPNVLNSGERKKIILSVWL